MLAVDYGKLRVVVKQEERLDLLERCTLGDTDEIITQVRRIEVADNNGLVTRTHKAILRYQRRTHTRSNHSITNRSVRNSPYFFVSFRMSVSNVETMNANLAIGLD